MKLLYPMGGTGSRMQQAGHTLPKPLLLAQGRPLFSYVMEMTAKVPGRSEYILAPELIYHLEALNARPGCWHALLDRTASVLHTLTELRDCLNEEEMLVCDCDSTMNPQELADAIEVFRRSDAEAGVTVRQTKDAHCSFVSMDYDWMVIEAREKDPFSPWSSTGPYWFRSGLQLRAWIERGIKNGLTSVAPLLNYPKRVKAVPVSSFIHLGTPEDLERFNAVSLT